LPRARLLPHAILLKEDPNATVLQKKRQEKAIRGMEDLQRTQDKSRDTQAVNTRIISTWMIST